MKKTPLPLAAAACLLLPCAHVLAQTSGTAHPELLNDNINDAGPAAAQNPYQTAPGDHYVKPSAGTPMPTPADAAPAYIAPAPPPSAENQTYSENAAPLPIVRSSVPTPVVTNDVDSGVVTSVPVGPNELAAATVLRTTLAQQISTRETLAGTQFTAVLSNDVGHDGRVLLPAGTVIHGRITQIHGGRRISGAAAIHLQPDTVSLPDGTTYRLDAEVIDLDHFEDSHVNSEGTIVANVHPGTTAAALGLTTTSAVIAGALIGGGVGAVVGLGVGAGVGAIWWLKRDHEQLLPAGTSVVFSLDRPLTVGIPAPISQ
jgi:hypothetical protein